VRVAGSETGESVEMARDGNDHESGEADDTDPEEDVVMGDETVLQEEQKNAVMIAMMDHNDQAEKRMEDEMEAAAIELEDLFALMQVCLQIPLGLISHICGS